MFETERQPAKGAATQTAIVCPAVVFGATGIHLGSDWSGV